MGKLTDEERAAIDEWISRNGEPRRVEAPAPRPSPPMPPMPPMPPREASRQPRVRWTPAARQPRPVEWLVVWAFRSERVDIDEGMPRLQPGISQTAKICDILERAAIVQGGGSSPESEDAIVIAAHVRKLGWHPRMTVVTYARAGRRPDPMVGAVPAVEPAEWRQNQWGRWPKVEALGRHPVTLEDGTVRFDDSLGCRIRIVPRPEEIRRARRVYTEWVQALAHVSALLRVTQPLRRWEVTTTLPPAQPWR